MLSDIIAHKRIEVQQMTLLDAVRTKPVIPFAESLRTKPFIAEVKKASPSAGDINLDVDPVAQAKAYAEAGAGAVSVLTDKKYFKGDIAFLQAVSREIAVPVLCKDFIVAPVQIENAYRAGADVILLIAAALTAVEMAELTAVARSFGLGILYEIHELDELSSVLPLQPEVVGVNSRNLKTMQIDLRHAAEVIAQLPDGFIKVAESGIGTAEDVQMLSDAGANAFLVGSSLMRAENPKAALQMLQSGVR